MLLTLRRGAISEIEEKVPLKGNLVFRHTDDDGDETVYADLAVGYPDEMGYYGDVVCIYKEGGRTWVTVRDAEGEDRDIDLNDMELSTDDIVNLAEYVEKAVICTE